MLLSPKPNLPTKKMSSSKKYKNWAEREERNDIKIDVERAELLIGTPRGPNRASKDWEPEY